MSFPGSGPAVTLLAADDTSTPPALLIVVGIVLIVLGGIAVVRPERSCRVPRWQYRNARSLEPSAAAVVVARVLGVVAVVVGIVVIVMEARR